MKFLCSNRSQAVPPSGCKDSLSGDDFSEFTSTPERISKEFRPSPNSVAISRTANPGTVFSKTLRVFHKRPWSGNESMQNIPTLAVCQLPSGDPRQPILLASASRNSQSGGRKR